ncbi:MAG: hypothetical protein N4A61_02475 [Pelagimonas sp.]|jgi:hypothetical protein|nr:hypothetical protein [Pelagimonas sp.]
MLATSLLTISLTAMVLLLIYELGDKKRSSRLRVLVATIALTSLIILASNQGISLRFP